MRNQLFIIIALLAFIMQSASIQAKAASDGLRYVVTGDTTVKVQKPQDESLYPRGKVMIPARVVIDDKTYTVTAIGSWGFFGCKDITEVELPGTITDIDIWAFTNCEGLTHFEFPSSVKRIGYAAFEGCTSLTSIELPSTITSVPERLFQECDNLTQVSLPSTITRIENSAFNRCKRLKNIVLPDSLKVIDNYAFSNCDSLGNIVFPAALERIGHDAFSCCYGMTSLTFPENLQSIGADAFHYCKNLERVYLPAGVGMSQGNPFSSCNKLKEITPAGGEKSPIIIDGVLFSHDMTELISFHPNHVVTSYVVPESVKVIASMAFYGNTTLKSVKMTAVEDIGSSAFNGCSSLEDVDFGKRLRSIGKEAFNSCGRIKKLYLPDSLESIGQIAFNFCSSLETVSVTEAMAKNEDCFNNVTFRFSGNNMTFIVRKPDGSTTAMGYKDLYDITQRYIDR